MSEVRVLPVLFDNYSYLVVEGQNALVIDPAEAGPVLEAVKDSGLTLTHILCTHHHYDHVAGNADVKNATGCAVIGPADPRIPELDQPVADGDTLDLAGGLRVIATPGHGSRDVSYYFPALGPAGSVFSGDTLFVSGCGRLMECGADALWTSLQKLAALPDATEVYCGHEYTDENIAFARSIDPANDALEAYQAEIRGRLKRREASVPSTIAREKAMNPFLQAGTANMKARLSMEAAPDADVFAELRRRKDRF